MTKRSTLIIVSIVFAVALLKFPWPETPKIQRVEVYVADANGYTLPYVRVEITDLKRGHKSEAQNLGVFPDGPFYEGRHRVVVKLGEESDKMNHVVYDRVVNFTKGMKTLYLGLDNVRQRFDIEIAAPGEKISLLSRAKKTIVISPHTAAR